MRDLLRLFLSIKSCFYHKTNRAFSRIDFQYVRKRREIVSKHVEGEYVVVKEGNMLTRIRKEEVDAYMELKRKRAETMLKEYDEYLLGKSRS